MASLAPCFAILDFGGTEILVIMVVVLIFFGGEKLPELARGLGKSIREFKKATSGIEEEFKRAMEEPPKRVTRPNRPEIVATKVPDPAAPAGHLDAPPVDPFTSEHGEY